MKRITLSLMVFCLTLMAMAEPVGKQAALYTAQSYMLAKGKNVNAVQKPFKAARRAATANDEEAYYYVFNSGDDGGYVIVSGDDRTEPVLGYVDHGSFDPDNIPDNMRSWLQSYADQIKYIVDNDIQPSSPLLKKRNKIQGTRHSVPELLTTRWDQGHPYNITCPKYYKADGTMDYPASGCVATAMAQVINFYKFPDKLKAQIPALTNTYQLSDGTLKSVTAPAISKGSIIDWENMRDTYSWNNNHIANAQDTAVANLMRYCGQAVNMGYGPQSGANFDANVFTKYFGFDDSAFKGDRNDYSIDQWFDLLYNDISAGYPVCFAGFSSGGGHAFVIDGFDGDNLFHVNWGWGGGSNGWFLISILNPGDTSGIGSSSSSDGYSMGQYALFNLRLPDSKKAEPTTALTINDISISGTTIKGNWINWTGAVGSFNTGIVKLNEDGTYSLVGTSQTITSMSVNTYQTKTFQMSGKLPEGTYKLSPASKLTTAKVWRPRFNMRDEYIEAVVTANGTMTLTKRNPVYDISIDTIVFPRLRIVGQEQEVKVTFRNHGDEYYKEVHLFASKTQNKVYTESRSMIAVRSAETVDVSYFFTPEETGTYNLWFCTGSDGNGEVGSGTMEIIQESQASKAKLTVNSFTISNSSSSTIYGDRIIGKATIKNNNNTDFNGKISVQVWHGDNPTWPGEKQTYDISAAPGKTVSINYEFDGLSSGNYYRLSVDYVNQNGSLSNGGLWDHRWQMADGIITWKNDGSVSAQAAKETLTAGSTACGMFARCSKDIKRLMPNNRYNPNTIYAFAEGMAKPSTLDEYNAVCGTQASHINLANNYAYYVPVSFVADSASYTYTFPDTEDGTKWHAFTMPFGVDSIYVDDLPVSLDDNSKHFCIYEFAAQGDDGEVIFAPATVLRGSTPYIIAGDAYMAGRSVVFRALGAAFSEQRSDKMIISSKDYKFLGNTYTRSIKDCYVLNADGNAFEYVTANTSLAPTSAYFATSLYEGLRLQSIVLPEIPLAPIPVGDFNGDYQVDISDAVSILDIMANGESGESNLRGDLNNDGTVDISDFVYILDIMSR